MVSESQAPYTHNQRQTSRICWCCSPLCSALWSRPVFGWGTVLQIVLAALTAGRPKPLFSTA